MIVFFVVLESMNVTRILRNKEHYGNKYTEFWSTEIFLRSRHSRIWACFPNLYLWFIFSLRCNFKV